MFKEASRLKLRFSTPIGLLSTEDLWDLPLESKTKVNLDSIAILLNREIKDTKEESFISKSKVNPVTELKLEIVKAIIAVKLQEADEKLKAKIKAEQRNKIDAIISKKEDASLEAMSLEELKALRNA